MPEKGKVKEKVTDIKAKDDIRKANYDENKD
jgi:hypothetical protein